MKNLKSSFQLGVKEGWGLFWSPFVGMFHTARDIILAKQRSSGVNRPFVAGLREGWIVFWSPLTAFCRAVKAVFGSK